MCFLSSPNQIHNLDRTQLPITEREKKKDFLHPTRYTTWTEHSPLLLRESKTVFLHLTRYTTWTEHSPLLLIESKTVCVCVCVTCVCVCVYARMFLSRGERCRCGYAQADISFAEAVCSDHAEVYVWEDCAGGSLNAIMTCSLCTALRYGLKSSWLHLRHVITISRKGPLLWNSDHGIYNGRVYVKKKCKKL